MNCEQVQERFSDRWDDALDASGRVAFDAHVEDCTGCAIEWAAYRQAVGALRQHGCDPTSPALRRELLAAVDADAGRAARRASALPIAVGAALLGAAAAIVLIWTFPFLRRVEPVERIVEVRVEVPVERIVERIVERRVEVPAAADVARVVDAVRGAAATIGRGLESGLAALRRPAPPAEVREVRVEVPVSRGPLLEVDTAPLAAAIASLSEHLGRGLEQGLAQAAERRAARAPAARPAGPVLTTGLRDETPGDRAAVHVRRSLGSVIVEPHGRMDEYVPILIAKLAYAEPAVRDAIEDQLYAVHARAASDPANEGRISAPPPLGPQQLSDDGSIFRNGRREPRVIVRQPQDRWAEWWRDNRARLAAMARPQASPRT